MAQLTGKIAIVTGAASGIGKAIAVRYGAEGAQVIVSDINAAGAEAVAQEILAAGGAALAVPTDVSKEAEVEAMFDTVLERFGTVDILLNNAGLVNTERHFLQSDSEWWHRIIGTNLSSVFLCSRRAAQVMARKRKGVIINMSSGGATRAHRGNVAYDAAKGGIEAMTRAMALDLGPYGVRVNGIVPGSIITRPMDPELKRERGAIMPLQRVGEAEDLAGPAVFLASDDAAYVTGHFVVVDGGMLAQQRSATVDIFPLSKFPEIEAE